MGFSLNGLSAVKIRAVALCLSYFTSMLYTVTWAGGLAQATGKITAKGNGTMQDWKRVYFQASVARL